MQLTRVDLDSDVFRNHDFINWLSINKENLSVDLSVIVYLETLFWYLTKSLSIDDFELDLEEIQAGITPFDSSLAQDAAERAIKSFQKANVRTQFKNNESKIVQGILSYESAVR